MAHCPYCESTRSLLLGHVFCSRHMHADMGALDSGTLFIRAPKLEETAEHISRLSIRLMLNGEQWYKVGGTDRRVHAGNFLVVNQGQRYRTAFQGEDELEMIMVGFRPGQVEDVYRSITARDEHLLDEPFTTGPPIGFFEQTYPNDPVIQRYFARLRDLMEAPVQERNDADVYTLHTGLLERLLFLQHGIAKAAGRLPHLSRSTRHEVWRRLYVARDLMEAHIERPLSVVDLARAACFSQHHFKRLFRDAFGTTPHRYLMRLRVARAKSLLATGRYSVGEVCTAVGYVDASSFVRLYTRETGRTPGSEKPFSHMPRVMAP